MSPIVTRYRALCPVGKRRSSVRRMCIMRVETSTPTVVRLETLRFGTIASVFKQIREHVFPSRTRLEAKRLSEISKHLLINLDKPRKGHVRPI